MNLVQAQQARQILDRLVGFELSPVVWQKVPGGKSAGRVQSPAVRLLVEREREIMKFEGSSQFKVTAIFIHDNQEFKAELNQKFDSRSSGASSS
ncbi:DNA topoisomerase [Candidatus Minimicrobia naudis]